MPKKSDNTPNHRYPHSWMLETAVPPPDPATPVPDGYPIETQPGPSARPSRFAPTFPWQPLFFKALVLGTLLLGLLWLMVRLKVVTAPILIGFFIAYALNPLVVRLRRWRVPPILALGVPVAAVAALAAVFMVWVLPKMAQDFVRASQHTPGSLYNYVLRLDPLAAQYTGHKLSEWIPYQDLSGMVQALANALIDPAQSRLTTLLSSAREVLVSVGKLLLVVVVAFFLLDDYERTLELVDGLVPRRHLAEVRRVVDRIDSVMAGFVRGQLMLFGLAALYLTVGMAVLGVNFWLIVGPMAAVLYLVPYVGVATGAVLTLLLQLLANAAGWQLLGAVGLFAAFYTVDMLVITPRLIGNRVGLPPLAVLLGIIAFGELFGVIGVLLAVPLLACGRILLLEAVDRYRNSATFLVTEAAVAQVPEHRDSTQPILGSAEEP